MTSRWICLQRHILNSALVCRLFCTERQSDNDSDNQVINNLSRTFDDVSTENTNPGLSDVISYLVACCFDVLLSKQHNVSESPGYEKLLKQFGRRQELWMWFYAREQFVAGTCTVLMSSFIFYVLFYTIYKRR